MKSLIFIFSILAVSGFGEGNPLGNVEKLKLRPNHGCAGCLEKRTPSNEKFEEVTPEKPTLVEQNLESNFSYVTILITCVGVLGNSHFIHTFFSFGDLQSPANSLLLELVVSDILFLGKIPIQLLNWNSSVGKLSEPGSKMAGFLDTLGITSFAVLSLAIAGERFYQTFHPTNINGIKWASVNLISHIVWFISWSRAVIPLLIEPPLTNWIVGGDIITQIAPLVITSIIYVKIWWKIWRKKETSNPVAEDGLSASDLESINEMRQRLQTEAAKTYLVGITFIIRALIFGETYFRVVSPFETERFQIFENVLFTVQIVAVSATPFVEIYLFYKMHKN